MAEAKGEWDEAGADHSQNNRTAVEITFFGLSECLHTILFTSYISGALCRRITTTGEGSKAIYGR